MSCPTCGKTMARLGCQYSECKGTWQCPVCGTLKVCHDARDDCDIIRPSLVDRCRKLKDIIQTSIEQNRTERSPDAFAEHFLSLVLMNLRSLGIDEAICLSSERIK